MDPTKRWTDGSPVGESVPTRADIFALALTDVIINKALSTYPDFAEAVVHALIAHAEQHKRLIDEMVRARSLQVIGAVIPISKADAVIKLGEERIAAVTLLARYRDTGPSDDLAAAVGEFLEEVGE